MADESLLPLREVTSHLRVLGESYVGLREIPIDKIVGSLDRSVDFDRLFRTRRRDLRRRLDALQVAFADRPMPPITVYEAGGLYFVVDGHHRVALSRRQGGAFIDAEVTKLRTSHRLHPGVDVLELVHTEQHRRFKERTKLKQVAPDAVIEFSRPIGYVELLQVIEAHAFELSEARGELVTLSDATRDWYAESWLPALEAIESSGLKRAYDFKTDGDRYLWTYQKLQELRATDRVAATADADPDRNAERRPFLTARWAAAAGAIKGGSDEPAAEDGRAPRLVDRRDGRARGPPVRRGARQADRDLR